jgi:cytochrome c556
MTRKDKIPKNANPEFQEVMKGVRGKNPYHVERVRQEKAKAKATEKALRKRKGKHRPGSGDDTIDTGMFDN